MLGVIIGHAELALQQVRVSDTVHQDLTEIRKAAEHSAELTRQLLAFARKQMVAPKTIKLNDTVEGLLRMLERLVGEGIRLVWRPQADVWSVRMDSSQVDQILVNLCVNARDAIGTRGTITVETRNVTVETSTSMSHGALGPGEYVRLAVDDNGCAMTEETLSHLFEPFFTTKGLGKGTGLGLATVYGAVRQNQGVIDVVSTLGKGSDFAIYLPRDTGSETQDDPSRSADAIGGGHETILLVEDEPALMRLTSRVLERLGYTVLATESAGRAIGMVEAHPGTIDLLITDVVMPEMTGLDLANRLLALRPELKRLFMSGYTAEVITHEGALHEDVRFIQKPFSARGLAVKVREVLDREDIG
jgi:CheY-like chemotaxis protein